MVMLLFLLLLSIATQVSAQSTLQLPDVTLFGEYTLFLSAPPPLDQDIPKAAGMNESRLSYPRSRFKVDLSVPDPPRFYWQRIPRSVLAPPGLLSLSAVEEQQAYAGRGQPPASGGWQARVDYIPGDTVASDFAGGRSSGVWDLSAELQVDLADGWVTNPPESPTGLILGTEARRRAEVLNIDAAFGLGAFQSLSASTDSSAVYTMGLTAGLDGQAGVFQWRERTRLAGISGIGGGVPPADPDIRRGAAQQDLELSLLGPRWELSLRSGGVLAAGLPSRDAERHGQASLELGWRNASSMLRLWAGAAALYYDDFLSFYPSGGFELYPADFLSLLFRAAPFVRLPPMHLQTLCAVQAVSADSATPQLRTEGGYSLYSELRFDPGATFGASFSFEWTEGRIYLLDASESAPKLELSLSGEDRAVLQGDLLWQMRAGRPGIRLNLTGELVVPFPLQTSPWENQLYSYAGVVWTADFHKLPVEFIITALTGDFADDGSKTFLFTNWELFSGSAAGIQVNWKLGKYGTVHTGFEAFLSPNFNYRFLVGYGIRR